MEPSKAQPGNIRGVPYAGTYVQLPDGSFRRKDDAVASKDTVRPKDTAVSKEASEIFGTSKNDANLNVPIGFQETLDATVKPTAFTYSFANVLNQNPNKKTVKIQELRNSEVVEGASVAIPMDAVEAVSARFANTLYGYFIGDRLAFPLVENYVNNTWAKYGLKRIQLHENFFMFQFNTKEGMESVMANGPWLIRYVPLILNIWTPTTDLKKDVISTAPLWVKMHHVPIVAYSEVGLSLIATQLGKPIMMDSYTSNMCVSSWGRNTYARVLVEFSADEELKKSIVVAIPRGNGKGHTLVTVDVEYEWTPPRCSICKVFDHKSEKCPTLPKVDVLVNEKNDGFTEVKRKKAKSKQNPMNKKVEGVRLSKPSLNLQYRRVEPGDTSKRNEKPVDRNVNPKLKPQVSKPLVSALNVENSFSLLEEKEDDNFYDNSRLNNEVLNASDDEVDEELLVGKDGTVTSKIPGASTPAVESHVRDSNLQRLCSLVFGNWDWTSNGAWCDKGSRIILGWNRDGVDVNVIDQNDQYIHTRVWLKKERKEVFCSFIYAHNKYVHRRSLWKSLCKHKAYIRNRPWSIMGDFNASLFPNESTAGSSKVDISMRDFRDCVEEIEVSDVQSSGLQFTWNQKPQGGIGIMKKLDRIMVNDEFRDQFMGAHAIFKPYRISDHSPSVLCIPTMSKMKPKPFKFFNVLTSHDRFLDVIKEEWTHYISGFHMYRVVKKLKNLKKPLRKLMYDKGNLHSNVTRLRDDLDVIQAAIDSDPFNMTFRDREAVCIADFNQAVLMEERFLKQKAKIKWLKEGDSNSAYYHKMVKSRVSKSRIDVVTNAEGVLFENDNVPNAFVTHYEMFLGHAGDMNEVNLDNLFKSRINDLDALDMVREVTNKEVKDALFSMGDDKSPGPDGYTAAFFKEAWSIVEVDVSNAIREFFRNGTILKELNHTIIALIPKVKAPMRVNDYRPISCCNVLFKCISKIIANRIKYCLKFIVSPNQSAFVPGRSITDNILLTQELMHNYHLDRGIPRCAFKVDIQKAYDTVDWSFLRMILHGFGFPDKMIAWIMECVSTTSYSISINGSLHGYFKGKRGLRQGDPLSPYLFTLVMEVLTLMLQRRVSMTEGFTYHRYCSKMDLINLCFADDLFLFAYGDVNSASIIKESLDEFKNASGLVPSLPKSTTYFCNVLNHVKLSILQILPFEEGRLPVKYLGVPLVSSSLMVRDCMSLCQGSDSYVQDWKKQSFPLPGRCSLSIGPWGPKHIIGFRSLPLPISSGINPLPKTSYLWRADLLDITFVIITKYPILPNYNTPINNELDRLVWSDRFGNIQKFSVSQVWSDIRSRNTKVDWYSMVWFPSCIPRHAINMWLIIRRKLKTQDLIPYWDVSSSLGSVCSLCELTPDSHVHLFFECPFASDVWNRMRGLAGLNASNSNIYDIIHDIMPFVKRRTSESVVAKLVVAATAYYIWQERNWRLFQKDKRKVDQIVDCIKTVVRLKLLSCKLKKSKSGERLARLWDLPDAIFI
ncbi:hypothetical protein Tco_0973099 [Tanacetum coccineum]